MNPLYDEIDLQFHDMSLLDLHNCSQLAKRKKNKTLMILKK